MIVRYVWYGVLIWWHGVVWCGVVCTVLCTVYHCVPYYDRAMTVHDHTVYCTMYQIVYHSVLMVLLFAQIFVWQQTYWRQNRRIL